MSMPRKANTISRISRIVSSMVSVFIDKRLQFLFENAAFHNAVMRVVGLAIGVAVADGGLLAAGFLKEALVRFKPFNGATPILWEMPINRHRQQCNIARGR